MLAAPALALLTGYKLIADSGNRVNHREKQGLKSKT